MTALSNDHTAHRTADTDDHACCATAQLKKEVLFH